MLLIIRSDEHVKFETDNVDSISLDEYTILIDRRNYYTRLDKRDNVIISQYKGILPHLIDIKEVNEIRANFLESYIEGNKKDILNSMQELDKILDGKYIIISRSTKTIARDILGLQALYYSRGIRLSSNKKYLWANNVNSIYSLPPNMILKMGKTALAYYKTILKILESPAKTKLSLSEVSQIYLEYTLTKTENLARKERIKEVVISYSGGIDSTLLTWITVNSGIQVHLITSGSDRSVDKDASKKAEKLFPGIDISFIKFDIDRLRKDLYEIVNIIEEYNPVSISVAIPQYYVFKETAKNNVFLGQGSDEFFGGYSKYIENYNYAEKLIRKDLIKSYRTNFEREDKLARKFNRKIYYPLISPSILLLAVAIPLKYKIRDKEDNLRKWIIRLAAKEAGIPKEFYLKKKHSMQYSSKSMQTLRKIAKKEGLRPLQLLYNIYRESRSRLIHSNNW